MTFVPSCHCCPTALPTDAAPNFVTVDGDLLTICGECWDADTDALVCDVCDRLAETVYDVSDVEDGCAPLAFWPWDWEMVCPACLWPLHAAEWVTRYDLPADAAEVAAALAGEWADDLDALADAARLLAGGVPA